MSKRKVLYYENFDLISTKEYGSPWLQAFLIELTVNQLFNECVDWS